MSVAHEYIGQGHAVGVVLRAIGLSRSVFYYQARQQRPGKQASTHTMTRTGIKVPNQQVVRQIQELLNQEFVDYGYIKVTWWLRNSHQYQINFKKVYRLMKQHHLLLARPGRRPDRQWVQQKVPAPGQAFEVIETDIKYIYIHGSRRMAYLLTAIDIYSRAVLVQMLRYSIRKHDVVELFSTLTKQYQLPEKVFVRNDNGSQFIAHMVRDYLKEMHITQEFIRPATPQQNGHIEAWHSIVERAVCQAIEFESLPMACSVFQRFARFYNHERLHSGIGYCSPVEYLRNHGVQVEIFDNPNLPFIQESSQANNDLSTNFSSSHKVESLLRF